MPTLTCSHGHRWEVPDATPLPGDGQPLSCPHCGAAHVTITRTDQPPADSAVTTTATGQPTTVVAAELPEVPGYEVLGELGRGGMGVVYKARQVKLKRLVALKMILSGAHAGPQEIDRFRTEAEAAARLQHPNIVQVHEVGEWGGLPYFSLEYVDGGSLAHRLAGAPLPAGEAAALVETLARAVHHAHERGVVHRDLKPANVLLSSQYSVLSTPKIADFGLAKQLDTDSGQTRSGAILGTPSYMAPEQAAGNSRIGPAADVYALGAILYETLTGRPPFRAATVLDTLEMVRSQEPVPPSRLQPKVPRDLETVCLKCLQKEPQRRYASALALAEDLHRFQAGEPIRARPVSAVERGVKWVRRRPGIAALTATTVLAVVLGFVGVFVQWQRAEKERGLAEERREQAVTAEQNAVAAAESERKAKDEAIEAKDAAVKAQEKAVRAEQAEREQKERVQANLYFHSVSLGEREWLAGNVDQAVRVLDDCPLWLRDWEWHYLKRLVRPEVFAHAHWQPASSVAFSSDARRLLLLRDEGVQVWDLASDQAVYPFALGHHPAKVLGMAVGPDPRRLATAGTDKRATLWLLEPDRARFADLKGHTGEVTAVTFSADGQRVASASQDGTVKLWETATLKELKTFRGHEGSVTAVAFRPNGQRLASAGTDKTVRVYEIETDKEVLTLRRHTSAVRSVTFSPDGTRIASVGKEGTAVIWDAESGQVLLTVREQGDVSSNVAFSPDGRRFAAGIAATERRGTVKVWDTLTGRELLAFHGHTAAVNGVAFSPDGTRLASVAQDTTARVWDVTTALEARILRAGVAGITRVAYSPDGRWLATTGGSREAGAPPGGEVKLWDAGSNQEVAGFLAHRAWVFGLAFSPDGKLLASLGADNSRAGPLNGEVNVWEVPTGRPVRTLDLGSQPGLMGCVGFSADGRSLFSLSADGKLRTWDASTGQETATISLTPPLPNGEQLTCACSPDGALVAAVTVPAGRGEVKVWDRATGKELLAVKGHTGMVGSLAFSRDGDTLAVGSGTEFAESGHRDPAGEIRVWDVRTGRALLTLTRAHAGMVTGLVFRPDGRRLASVSEDRTAKLWDTTTGQLAFTLRGHMEPLSGTAFSPDGRKLATGCYDGSVRIWDGTATREILALRTTHGPGRVAFSPDGKRLIAVGWPSFANVWEAATGKEVLAVAEESGPINAAFTPDTGKLVLLGGSKTIDVRDGTTSKVLASWRAPAGEVTSLRLSPDGRRVAVATKKNDVSVWEAETGQELYTFSGAGTEVLFTPDSQRLVTSSEGGPGKVWEMSTGREAFPLPGAGEHVIVSPDGRWLASTDKQKTLTVWDAATGRQVHRVPDGGIPKAFSSDGQHFVTVPRDAILAIWSTTLGKPTAVVRSPSSFNGVVFSPDGSRLAWGSGMPDGLVTVADAETGRKLLSLRGHTNWVSGIAFSPDGRRLASVSPLDQTARVWDIAEREEDKEPAGKQPLTWHAQEADESEAASQWFAAIYHLERLLSAQPESAALRLRRGRARTHLGQSEQALEDFAAVLKQTPEDGTAWLAQFVAHARLGQADKAAADYAKAVGYSRAINKPLPWWVIDRTPLDDRHMRSWQAALADCTRTVDGGVTDVWAWRARALANAALGQWDQAVADFSHAIDGNKEDWEALRGRSLALESRGKFDEAAADCARALELKKDDGNLWRIQATLWARRSQWAKAIESYDRAIDLGVIGWAAWAEHGQARAALRQWDKAVADFSKAVELGADRWEVWARHGSALAETGEWERATESLARASDKADQPWPGYELALLRLHGGDREGYQKACAALVERFGHAGNPYLSPPVIRACVVGDGKGIDRARVVQLAEQLVKANPRSAPFLVMLAAAQCRAGKFEEAVGRLNEAIKLYGNEGTPESWLYLALAHRGLGHAEEASKWLERASKWVELNAPEKPRVGTPSLAWQTRLELRLLLREAKKQP